MCTQMNCLVTAYVSLCSTSPLCSHHDGCATNWLWSRQATRKVLPEIWNQTSYWYFRCHPRERWRRRHPLADLTRTKDSNWAKPQWPFADEFMDGNCTTQDPQWTRIWKPMLKEWEKRGRERPFIEGHVVDSDWLFSTAGSNDFWFKDFCSQDGMDASIQTLFWGWWKL